MNKLAKDEFADELIVVAVALEFSIRIVIIPYTPVRATHPWAIPCYGPLGVPQDGRRTVYLGNNDVHYVYLRALPETPRRIRITHKGKGVV